MRQARTRSFERFYYERIGIGEGCGCAELIIGTHDHDTPGHGPAARRGSIGRIIRALARAEMSKILEGARYHDSPP
jgi:hypothetical protein